VIGGPKSGKVANASGWQRDPTQRDRLRYRDGNAWTARVADGTTAEIDPEGSEGTAEELTAQHRARRRKGIATVGACLASLVVVVLIARWATSGGGQYGYSSDGKYKTVELVHERRPQPSFGKKLSPVDALDSYLEAHGVDCPNFAQAFNFGTDNPWAGDCRRNTGLLAAYVLYQLEVFKSSGEKRDQIGGSVHGCEVSGRHEYWIEGPDWAVAVYDRDQQTKAANEASTHDLAVQMADATGARLYRAC
jgi:hypothetical protein